LILAEVNYFDGIFIIREFVMRKDLVLQTGGVDKNYIIINFKFNLLKLFNIKNNFFKTIYESRSRTKERIFLL